MTMVSPKPKSLQAAMGRKNPTSMKTGPLFERQNSRAGNHPVEVVGRIREHPEGNDKESAIRVLPHSKLSIKSDQGHGYREFSLDGVSLAAFETLQAFYNRYVEARVEDVKGGARCTIMMYGPTGAGKSYTMFGAGLEKGVAHHALTQLMTNRTIEGEDCRIATDQGIEVRATVWEIYNEEIYDLLASVSTPKSSLGGLFKGMNGGRVRLEVMGKKVKTSMSISGTDPQKLLREISKVEGRRVVKSTNCNDRSSRSHCIVTLDVPAVGGKLVLVDMAGSENLEQAGLGRELKMQTGKINQGNGALKRVVEAIANNDSYIPYRDSKLTMLLQDSFEDDRAKILMVLCASPDPRDLHKTINTLEYGAKAKCIVRLPNSPLKEQLSAAKAEQLGVLEARLSKKDAYIEKLRRDNETKNRENEEREQELERKERELADLREKEKKRTPGKLDGELQKKRKGFHDDDDEDLNLSPARKRKIDELTALVTQQQREIDLMRVRAEKAEAELLHLQRSYNLNSNARVVQTQVESSSGKEGLDKRMSGLSPSALGSQRFQDIHKQISDRITFAQAETNRINARHTLEDRERKSSVDTKQKSGGNRHEGSRLEGESASSSPRDMNSLTVKSPSLQLLKNLVKDKERQNSLGHEETTQNEAMNGMTTTPTIDKEENKAAKWNEENLCSKGWLPIILEGDERIAQSMEGLKGVNIEHLVKTQEKASLPSTSNTPESSGQDYSTFWSHEVTPEGVNKVKEEDPQVDLCPSLTFSSPVEQFSPALANFTNGSGFDSPLQNWGGFGVQRGPVASANFSGSGSSTSPREFVFGATRDIKEEVKQHDSWNFKVGYSSQSPQEIKEAPHSGSARHESPDENMEPEYFEPLLSNLGTDLFDGGQSGGSEAEAARRARIESIFLLCGEKREIAAHKGSAPSSITESQESFPEASARESPASQYLYGSQFFTENHLDQSVSDFSTSPSQSETTYTDVSSLPSPMPAVSPQRFPSPRRPTRRITSSIFANENAPQPQQEGERTDVYVKWEKSTDPAGGKLICIVNVAKTVSLAELREEVEAHIPVAKKNFKFLILGEPGGAPVDRELESDLRVASLPDSQQNHGSRLACLRPPLTHTLFVTPYRADQPFRSLENQLSAAHEQNNYTNSDKRVKNITKAGGGLSSSKTPSSASGQIKGLRPSNGEVPRPSLSFKEKATLAHVQELASKLDYYKLKDFISYNPESYLVDVSNPVLRWIIACYRTSSHDLLVEKG